MDTKQTKQVGRLASGTFCSSCLFVRFLNLSLVTSGVGSFFAWRCPVPCGMFSSVLGFHPLDASSAPVRCDSPVSPGGRIASVGSHWCVYLWSRLPSFLSLLWTFGGAGGSWVSHPGKRDFLFLRCACPTLSGSPACPVGSHCAWCWSCSALTYKVG